MARAILPATRQLRLSIGLAPCLAAEAACYNPRPGSPFKVGLQFQAGPSPASVVNNKP